MSRMSGYTVDDDLETIMLNDEDHMEGAMPNVREIIHVKKWK